MELNQTAQELIATFAKANRVSNAKTTELVTQILASYGVKTKNAKRGRNASEVILALRKQIEDALPSMIEEKTHITAKDIAEQFNVEYISAYNTIAIFEKMGYFVRDGKKESDLGGRKQVVWAAVAQQ